MVTHDLYALSIIILHTIQPDGPSQVSSLVSPSLAVVLTSPFDLCENKYAYDYVLL